MTDSDLVAHLKTRLAYDPATGLFSWIGKQPKKKSSSGHAGGNAGRGYIGITVDGRKYAAHRLAIAFTTGEWPKEHTDHINGDTSDNRIANLRVATFSENGRNRKVRCDAKSGVKGVSFCPQTRKWKACIQVHGKERTLGRYDTIKQAADVYAEHAKALHGEFARFQIVGG